MSNSGRLLVLRVLPNEPVQRYANPGFCVFERLVKLQPAKTLMCVLHRYAPSIAWLPPRIHFGARTRIAWRRRLFERALLPSGEHHGEFLNEAFPLSDDGCPVRLFLRQLRRNLLALPGGDVSLFTDAKNAVDQTRTRDQANLARVKWCERPSSDYCGLRRQNSCRLTGRR